jgi:hypothetical protein
MVISKGRLALALILALAGAFLSPLAQADIGAKKAGIVVMHGKGGSPSGFVADFAASLERQGCLVANLVNAPSTSSKAIAEWVAAVANAQ